MRTVSVLVRTGKGPETYASARHIFLSTGRKIFFVERCYSVLKRRSCHILSVAGAWRYPFYFPFAVIRFCKKKQKKTSASTSEEQQRKMYVCNKHEGREARLLVRIVIVRDIFRQHVYHRGKRHHLLLDRRRWCSGSPPCLAVPVAAAAATEGVPHA